MRKRMWKIAGKAALVGGLAAALLLTYDKCIECVLCVAVMSAITMNCVPLMPLVFVLSVAVLMMHAIDYDKVRSGATDAAFINC